MKIDSDTVVIAVTGTIVAIGLFLGTMRILAKITSAPKKAINYDTYDARREQQERIEETERQRKKMIQDNKQKLKDMRRRNP
ncbi:MAG: hypothetical protein P9X22_04530 [Candidatus Zapsychrus exili]|nr:hypothetical protein [Candidatus Zapsychrus exili]